MNITSCITIWYQYLFVIQSHFLGKDLCIAVLFLEYKSSSETYVITLLSLGFWFVCKSIFFIKYNLIISMNMFIGIVIFKSIFVNHESPSNFDKCSSPLCWQSRNEETWYQPPTSGWNCGEHAGHWLQFSFSLGILQKICNNFCFVPIVTGGGALVAADINQEPLLLLKNFILWPGLCVFRHYWSIICTLGSVICHKLIYSLEKERYIQVKFGEF